MQQPTNLLWAGLLNLCARALHTGATLLCGPPPAGPEVLALQALLQRWLIWADMTYPNCTYPPSLGSLPQDTYNALHNGKPCGC